MLKATNINDILFDDLVAIRSLQTSNNSANSAIDYGDCGNRFETETSEALISSTLYTTDRVIAFGDCGN